MFIYMRMHAWCLSVDWSHKAYFCSLFSVTIQHPGRTEQVTDDKDNPDQQRMYFSGHMYVQSLYPEHIPKLVWAVSQ